MHQRPLRPSHPIRMNHRPPVPSRGQPLTVNLAEAFHRRLSRGQHELSTWWRTLGRLGRRQLPRAASGPLRNGQLVADRPRPSLRQRSPAKPVDCCGPPGSTPEPTPPRSATQCKDSRHRCLLSSGAFPAVDRLAIDYALRRGHSGHSSPDQSRRRPCPLTSETPQRHAAASDARAAAARRPIKLSLLSAAVLSYRHGPVRTTGRSIMAT
jgi:hypothetical protein